MHKKYYIRRRDYNRWSEFRLLGTVQ